MNLTGYFKGYMAKKSDRQPLDMPPAGEPVYIDNPQDIDQIQQDKAYKKDTKPQARAQQKGTGYE